MTTMTSSQDSYVCILACPLEELNVNQLFTLMIGTMPPNRIQITQFLKLNQYCSLLYQRLVLLIHTSSYSDFLKLIQLGVYYYPVCA